MTCKQCGIEVERNTSFEIGKGEYLCADCFTTRAQEAGTKRKLSGQDKERLRKAVKEELSGLLPRDVLKDLIEDGYRRILLKREDVDVVAGSLVNEIERMAGVAVCRKVLEFMHGMTDAIQKGITEEENEIRNSLRRISGISPGA